MRKEKVVKSYQRKTKSGKVVTVKAHKVEYDASDKSKSTTKKKGSGKELEEKMNKRKKEIPDIRLRSKGLSGLENLSPLRSTRPVGGGITGLEPKSKM